MILGQSIHIPNNSIVVTVLQLFHTDAEFYRPVAESSGKVAESSGRVADNERIILDYLQTQSTITSKLVETLVGVQGARARRILQEMTKKGVIEKCGSGRSTYYVRGKA